MDRTRAPQRTALLYCCRARNSTKHPKQAQHSQAGRASERFFEFKSTSNVGKHRGRHTH